MVEPKPIRIYVCGPTVYDTPHIGNLRPVISFDLFTRALAHRGLPFVYVHNVTDIDDKIIRRALDQNEAEASVAQRYLHEYRALLRLYNVQRPTFMPRVTQNLAAIRRVISQLSERGVTYQTPTGVFFATEQVPTYGEVSGQNRAALRHEENVASAKRDPADFALWKTTREGVQYPSPWGPGRPGWHTECVAFINKYFGAAGVTVHGGGVDLLFPHHENENAQFRALYGQPITTSWRHSGQILWQGAKMSKSLGNVIDAKFFAQEYGPDTLRWLILQSNFAAPLNLGLEQIQAAQALVEKYAQTYRKALLICSEPQAVTPESLEIAAALSAFNFAAARTFLHNVVKSFNADGETASAVAVITCFKLLAFGFTKKIITNYERFIYNSWVDLRKQHQYEAADRLRKQLIKRKLL